MQPVHAACVRALKPPACESSAGCEPRAACDYNAGCEPHAARAQNVAPCVLAVHEATCYPEYHDGLFPLGVAGWRAFCARCSPLQPGGQLNTGCEPGIPRTKTGYSLSVARWPQGHDGFPLRVLDR
jgi:hypothetical protein